jgi:multidrug efflux pump subunit AcrB
VSHPIAPPPPAAPPGHWTERHGKPILFIILTLAAAGIYLATTIPVAVFPETNFPRIVVGVDNGVMPIDQMMVTITRPIEEALNTVPGLERVISVTSRGSAEIDLFFTWRVDMVRTLALANAALSRVQPTLPSTARIRADRLTFAAFPIMGYSLTSDTVPQTELWERAKYLWRPRINRLPGVASVVQQGGMQPDFEITANPNQLVQTGVTVQDILDAVGHSNLVDSPGLIERLHQLYLALVTGQTASTQEISGIVLKVTPQGTPVRVGDVAEVKAATIPGFTMVTANGRRAVLLNIFRQPDSNTVAVADAVREEVRQIRSTMPPGVKMEPFYDQSGLVRDSMRSVRDAVAIGLILASLIMVLFLRDWGASLVAGPVIPATIAVTFLLMRAAGEKFNLMTLGGLAAAVGLVIDDAIVVVENIVAHRDAGEPGGEAVRRALAEVRKPLIGSTVTPIAVLVPLLSITGLTGVFFGALAVTMALALLTSLALALTWMPALSHYFLRPRSPRTAPESVPGWLMRHYEMALRKVLEHPAWLAALALALIGVGFFCYARLGTDLLPAIDEGQFVLDYIMPAGASLADTNRVVTHVERILRGVPEVASTSRRTGLQLGLAAVTEANTGDILVRLSTKRRRSTEEVIEDVRAQVTQAEPVLDVEFTQVLQDMIGDLTSAPEPVVIKLFSENRAMLDAWAPKVAERIKTIPGIVDVRNGIENTVSGPAIVFAVDPVVTAKAGFTPREVEVDASAVLQGEEARRRRWPTIARIRSGWFFRNRRARTWTRSGTRCW